MAQIITSYTVQEGDTLSKIAARFGLSLQDVLEVNQQIHNPDLIMVGQVINITESTTPPAPGRLFDGVHPAPGTTVAVQSRYAEPPLTNDTGNRHVDTYTEVIDQFAVGHNPRHLARDGFTFCNIFLWDVTRAMGAEVPHWIDSSGDIAVPFSPGAQELTINAGVDWLNRHGDTHGWSPASEEQAQESANLGRLGVVVWKNPTGGHGHTAIIRPGSITNDGPLIAQAGRRNFNAGRLQQGFGTRQGLQFFIHT